MAQDAIALLEADHQRVEGLFREFKSASGDPMAKRHLAQIICMELTLHAQIEEVFYPALREAVPNAAPLLDEAQSEHQKVKDLVARIQGMDSAGPQMDEQVAQLAGLVEHHVKEERDELFRKAKTAKALDLTDLGTQLRERQQALQAEAETATTRPA
jgi:hemerythrin superfamily protein